VGALIQLSYITDDTAAASSSNSVMMMMMMMMLCNVQLINCTWTECDFKANHNVAAPTNIT
jgi:hypothetical protein